MERICFCDRHRDDPAAQHNRITDQSHVRNLACDSAFILRDTMAVIINSVSSVAIDGVTVGNLVDAIANYPSRRTEILAAAVANEQEFTRRASDAEATAAGSQGQNDSLTARIAELEAILYPVNAIWPNQFQRLLTSPQRAVLWTSTESQLIDLVVDLLTIASPIPFGEGSELQAAVMGLGQLLPDLFTPGEVARIIARKPPE